jgi:hypothetical protein
MPEDGRKDKYAVLRDRWLSLANEWLKLAEQIECSCM